MARRGDREWQGVQRDVGGWVPRPGLVQGRPVDRMGGILHTHTHTLNPSHRSEGGFPLSQWSTEPGQAST